MKIFNLVSPVFHLSCIIINLKVSGTFQQLEISRESEDVIPQPCNSEESILDDPDDIEDLERSEPRTPVTKTLTTFSDLNLDTVYEIAQRLPPHEFETISALVGRRNYNDFATYMNYTDSWAVKDDSKSNEIDYYSRLKMDDYTNVIRSSKSLSKAMMKKLKKLRENEEELDQPVTELPVRERVREVFDEQEVAKEANRAKAYFRTLLSKSLRATKLGESSEIHSCQNLFANLYVKILKNCSSYLEENSHSEVEQCQNSNFVCPSELLSSCNCGTGGIKSDSLKLKTKSNAALLGESFYNVFREKMPYEARLQAPRLNFDIQKFTLRFVQVTQAVFVGLDESDNFEPLRFYIAVSEAETNSGYPHQDPDTDIPGLLPQASKGRWLDLITKILNKIDHNSNDTNGREVVVKFLKHFLEGFWKNYRVIDIKNESNNVRGANPIMMPRPKQHDASVFGSHSKNIFDVDKLSNLSTNVTNRVGGVIDFGIAFAGFGLMNNNHNESFSSLNRNLHTLFSLAEPVALHYTYAISKIFQHQFDLTFGSHKKHHEIYKVIGTRRVPLYATKGNNVFRRTVFENIISYDWYIKTNKSYSESDSSTDLNRSDSFSDLESEQDTILNIIREHKSLMRFRNRGDLEVVSTTIPTPDEFASDMIISPLSFETIRSLIPINSSNNVDLFLLSRLLAHTTLQSSVVGAQTKIGSGTSTKRDTSRTPLSYGSVLLRSRLVAQILRQSDVIPITLEKIEESKRRAKEIELQARILRRPVVMMAKGCNFLESSCRCRPNVDNDGFNVKRIDRFLSESSDLMPEHVHFDNLERLSTLVDFFGAVPERMLKQWMMLRESEFDEFKSELHKFDTYVVIRSQIIELFNQIFQFCVEFGSDSDKVTGNQVTDTRSAAAANATPNVSSEVPVSLGLRNSDPNKEMRDFQVRLKHLKFMAQDVEERFRSFRIQP